MRLEHVTRSIVLLLDDKQYLSRKELSQIIPHILAMLCKLPNPLSKLPGTELEASVFRSRVHSQYTLAYVSV